MFLSFGFEVEQLTRELQTAHQEIANLSSKLTEYQASTLADGAKDQLVSGLQAEIADLTQANKQLDA